MAKCESVESKFAHDWDVNWEKVGGSEELHRGSSNPVSNQDVGWLWGSTDHRLPRPPVYLSVGLRDVTDINNTRFIFYPLALFSTADPERTFLFKKTYSKVSVSFQYNIAVVFHQTALLLFFRYTIRYI